MARLNDSQPRNMTVESFKQEMAAFVAHMKGVVTPNPKTGRALFPDFIVTKPIREKLECAVGHLGKEELGKAFWILDTARDHFQNQQASYARRTLLPDLQGDLQEMIRVVRKGDDDDLVSPVRNAVEAYEKLVGQDFFETSEASRFYWAAIDALNSAEDQYKSRIEKKRQDDLAAKRKRQAELDEQSKTRNRERSAAAANELKDLLGTV